MISRNPGSHFGNLPDTIFPFSRISRISRIAFAMSKIYRICRIYRITFAMAKIYRIYRIRE